MPEHKQRQVNIRLDEHLYRLIDACRVEAHSETGGIPTRSDVIREAICEYLERRGKLPSDDRGVGSDG